MDKQLSRAYASFSSMFADHKVRIVSIGGVAMLSAVKFPAKNNGTDYFWVGAFGRWFYVGSL